MDGSLLWTMRILITKIYIEVYQEEADDTEEESQVEARVSNEKDMERDQEMYDEYTDEEKKVRGGGEKEFMKDHEEREGEGGKRTDELIQGEETLKFTYDVDKN